MLKLGLYVSLPAILLATPAHAYIGPGAGTGLIVVVLGVLASVVLAFVSIIWFPIKRMFKRREASAKKVANIRTGKK